MLTWPQNRGQYVKGSQNRHGVRLRDSVKSYPGRDGNLYVTEFDAGKIAEVTLPAGVVHELDIPTPNSSPWDILGGPDGNIWFAESWTGQIGKLWLSR